MREEIRAGRITMPGKASAILKRISLTLSCLAAGMLLHALTAASAMAAACQEIILTQDMVRAWWNPHPEASDFELPIPLGMSLAFVPVRLGSNDLYGDERTIYFMGKQAGDTVYETNLKARVGSSISDGKERLLLMGKYELSIGQYVAVMGAGSLQKGISTLVERTQDGDLRNKLSAYVDPNSSCRGKMTKDIARLLSEPLTFLSYRDYVDFIDTFNLACISSSRCSERLARLGRNIDVAGFVRLPMEFEWEFVARGGGQRVKGKITPPQMQTDLPPLPEGKPIEAFAHIDNDPQYMLPIGSREPLFGFYDMLGNAMELMQNPFTSENGFGAVGGYVARGGSYKTKKQDLRVSNRTEWPAFRRDDVTNSMVLQSFPRTGLRLVVGYPVSGMEDRIGSTANAIAEFGKYVPPDEAGDQAGNTLAEAKDIGQATARRPIALKDGLSPKDLVDFYKFRLGEYAKVRLDVKEAGQQLRIEVMDESQASYMSETRGKGGTADSKPMMPGTYYVKLSPAGSPADSKYELALSVEAVPDTGLERPDTAALAKAFAVTKSAPISVSGYVGDGDRGSRSCAPRRSVSNWGG